jgi:hypothetical protein
MRDLIIIIIVIIIIFGIYKLITETEKNKNKISDESLCNLENFDIDDMYIIKRGKEYEKYINKLIDKNKKYFNKEELKILKNKFQFYNIKDKDDIKNISNQIYGNCKNKLKDANVNINDPDEDISLDNIELLNDPSYFKTLKQINNNIDEIKINCDNTNVLKDNDYLKNYYIDVDGNNIKASLKDYFADYYAQINEKKEDKCIKVNTKKIGNYMFIPNQFDTQKYLTNAYNIDYNRIINPWTIY